MEGTHVTERVFTREDWLSAVGTMTGQAGPMPIDQARIDAFAEATNDWQAIHVDPVAAATGPFGATIAHGFLVLSLLAPMAYEALPEHPAGAMLIHRGFHKVRFVTPVVVGSELVAQFTLVEAEDKDGTLRLAHDVTVTLAGSGKPALAARWLTMSICGETA